MFIVCPTVDWTLDYQVQNSYRRMKLECMLPKARMLMFVETWSLVFWFPSQVFKHLINNILMVYGGGSLPSSAAVPRQVQSIKEQAVAYVRWVGSVYLFLSHPSSHLMFLFLFLAVSNSDSIFQSFRIEHPADPELFYFGTRPISALGKALVFFSMVTSFTIIWLSLELNVLHLWLGFYSIFLWCSVLCCSLVDNYGVQTAVCWS